jgi:hypothetical protein
MALAAIIDVLDACSCLMAFLGVVGYKNDDGVHK